MLAFLVIALRVSQNYVCPKQPSTEQKMWDDGKVKAFVDCQCVLHWLRLGFDRSNCCVGIAGSFALLYYMRIVLDLKPRWQPGDCDFYVFACDRDTFRNKVRDFGLYLKRYGVRFAHGKVRENRYSGDARIPLVVWDVIVGAKNFKLSFIHHPSATSMSDIVAEFDMDIVRVRLDPFENEFCVEEGVRRAIIAGTAEVRPFVFRNVVPTEEEAYLLAATLSRMRKYKKRGFLFTKTPSISSMEAEDIATDAQGAQMFN